MTMRRAQRWRRGGLLAGVPLLALATTVIDLQDRRQTETLALRDAAGRAGEIGLVQLAPAVNAWLLLTLRAPGRDEATAYHLENADPAGQRVALDPAAGGQLRFSAGAPCRLWPGDALASAARSKLPYAPLCDGRLYLRNRVAGSRSTLEATTEFLRDHVWHGEQIIGFVKRGFYRDAFVEHAASAPPAAATPGADSAGAPPPAALQGADAARPLQAEGLGLALATSGRALLPGRWYAAAGLDAVWASIVTARLVAAAPRHAPDAVEAQALDFLVAFDLSVFDLGFELGTEHPRLGWSARVRDALRDDTRPGPDGIGDAAPLVRTGMLAPPLQARAVATFTGGFKREHGAFHSGALAQVNAGSHYGFVDQGVVLSRLQPGLATLLVRTDGGVDMRTWTHADDATLATVRDARQNGVPLVEPDRGGRPAAGALVDRWGEGNWSGSADEKLRTLRAGACLVEHGGRRFLVYGYFSTATPRTMAQVFLAYGCRYAMHLDMNALEHTYLALYPEAGAARGVEHLVPGMALLDRSLGGALLPRFLAFPDDRDFFYLLARGRRR